MPFSTVSEVGDMPVEVPLIRVTLQLAELPFWLAVMVVVPADLPVITPLESTVATEVSELVQVGLSAPVCQKAY